MPFFLDTQETSQRFGKHIAGFCSLLDTNHIRYGSPDDLFEFARILENSNQFRFDLSALVKTVAHSEGDELLLTDMMGIIVAAVGGPTATNTTADLTRPSNTLMEFLLGTGCWRKFGSPSSPVSAAPPIAPSRPITHSPPPSPSPSPPVTPNTSSVAPAPKPPVRAQEPPSARSSPPATPIPVAAPHVAPPSAHPVAASPVAPEPATAASIPTAPVPVAPAIVTPATVTPVPVAGESADSRASLLDASSELRQTLTRLEINTLQVKLHLESIEQRMNRIEPPPVRPTPQPTAAIPTATVPEPPPNAPASPVTASPRAVSPVPISRVPVPPAPVPLPPIPPPPVEPPPAADSSSGKFSLFGAEAAPTFEAELPARGRAVFSRPVQQDEPTPYRDPGSDSDSDDLSSPTFAFASEKGRNMVPVGVFLVLLAILLAFLFARSGAGLKAVGALFGSGAENVSSTTAGTPSGSPAAAAPSTPTPSPGLSDGDGANASPTAASEPSTAASEPSSSKFKYVSPSVMAGNLLSAPRPEYPASARAAHITGTVALQATISRAGSIRTLHAIKGPPALRQAAIDAVRGWRYKPYLVDGRPVDVATTVYVEFTLGPPPTIAH
jgi:TonB family protein